LYDTLENVASLIDATLFPEYEYETDDGAGVSHVDLRYAAISALCLLVPACPD
jgi:hypothetical protein